MPYRELLRERYLESNDLSDYHILRFLASFVAVSNGSVVGIKGPVLQSCPLVHMLYGDIDSGKDIQGEIRRLVEKKIFEFGFFTFNRKFDQTQISVPFGASEMLMYAMRQKYVDAAVIVCDGAGSVIAADPEIVQGIGARMNGLFFTSPIPEIIEKLTKANCRVVFSDASIDQIQATEEACKMGCKNIAVTINGYMEQEQLSKIKDLERQYSVNIISLIVCTTGVSEKRTNEIGEYGDLVWSCASEGIRKIVGEKAILQISKRIPVFVLTEKGLNFVSAYSNNGEKLMELDKDKQYLLSRTTKGKKIIMGENFTYYLSESNLPVRSKKEPKFILNSKENQSEAFRPGDDCNCPVCVFSKSHAPGDAYDLEKCPKWNSTKKDDD